MVAQALADIATIAILQNRSWTEAQVLSAQLSTALSSRIVIEQAKGIIAERQHVAIDEAFHRLRRYARDHNLRLADVARDAVFGDVDLDELVPRQRTR
jgi:AmiR/NasT family two-component response regulator